MKNNIAGRIRINAAGNDLYGFINALHSSSVKCSGQYVKKDIFYADIRRCDLKETEALASLYGITLSCAEYETISRKLRRYKKRLGIIFGVLIVVISSLYFSNVVVTIEINGNSRVSDKAILAALEELDIKKGTPLSSINFHHCENELRVMVQGVSWAAIRHTGNRVVVDVTEIVEKPEIELKRIPCNIISTKDAHITYTTVYDGMLMHKVGDYVPAGTLLVTGVTTDDTGHSTLHHAMGEIRGIYKETLTFTGEYNTEERTSTGKTETKRRLCLFSLEIPMYIRKTDFKDYDSSETESYLKLFGKQLPIGMKKEKLSETNIQPQTFTKEELSQKLMQKIYLYEKNFLHDKKILDRKITESDSDESLTFTVTYQLEGNIGTQREIFVK
ncbi:MAG: sporulation protein YqfD [Ruminococcus sp.]|nr:sporulation protein YqfD [Ruminococcus sp.]MBQ9078075.1 sporulation protein YqfD [Ruminococcus sp.]